VTQLQAFIDFKTSWFAKFIDIFGRALLLTLRPEQVYFRPSDGSAAGLRGHGLPPASKRAS